MLRRLSLALSFAVAACPLAAPAAELTAPEMRWLQGIAPVVQHARQQLGLPLDDAVLEEARLAQAAKEQEAQSGASRFAEGAGRHGSFEEKGTP